MFVLSCVGFTSLAHHGRLVNVAALCCMSTCPVSVHADEPPLNVVRKFVHLLDQSDTDYAEEIGRCST